MMAREKTLTSAQNIAIVPPLEALSLRPNQYEARLSGEETILASPELRRIETMDYQQKQLALLMDNIKEAIWVVDIALRTLDINPTACRLLDWEAETVIGQSYLTIMSKNPENSHQVLANYLEQAITSGKKVPFNQGITLNLKNNRSILIEGATHPLFDQGQVIGATAVFRPASPSQCVEQMQADFIALASHNLRTPLMSIQAALDYVLETKSDQEKSERLLAEARRQSQKIAHFLQDLLDISKLTLDREIPLKIKPVNFSSLIQSIIADLEKDGTDGAIKMTYQLDIPADLPLIAADEAKIEIILRNLIAHMKGRNKPGGILTISIIEKDDDVIVSILDNGPPISPKQYQQIFWQVYPLEANGNGSSISYGYSLGLYSTRRLVELFGGHIWISQPSSQETWFNFSLPIWR